MATTYGERLQTALKHARKSVADLARHLVGPEGDRGVSPSSVHQVLRGQTKAHTAENCVRAARFLQVDPFWLATGEGPMLAQVSTALLAQEPLPPPYTCSDEAALTSLRALLQRLPPEARAIAADILSGWARGGGEDDRSQVLLGLAAAQPKRQAAGGITRM